MGRLPSRRAGRLFAALAPAVLVLSVAPALAQTEARLSVSGVVRDSVGTLLSNVEVLLVDPAGKPSPEAVAHSDDAGRFDFEGLTPAIYRIAALKDGYLTFIGKVDPRIDHWVQVVLHPLPDLDDELAQKVPDRTSWALRRARRYVLYDDDPRVVRDAGALGDPGDFAALEDALVMQVDQLFPVASAAGAGDPGHPEVRGSQTRLRVASAVGERASIDVEGYRELVDSSSSDGAAVAAASRDTAAVSLAFSYDTSPAGQLDVNAFYNQGGLEVTNGPVDPLAPGVAAGSSRRGHRQWGYDARWSTDLDEIGTVAVQLDYNDTALDVPDGHEAPAFDESGRSPEQLYTRAVGASGVWTTVPIDDHAVQVGLRAQVLDSTDPTTAAIARTDLALSGMSLGLNVQDTWSIARPFAVIYGLGYRQALGARDASLVVPQVGGLWRVSRLTIRGVVSYHGVTGWSRVAPALERLEPLRPQSALGYEADVELPLTHGLRLAATSLYSPIQVDLAGYSGGGFHRDPRPLYLTDGNAAAREHRLALIHESQDVRFYVEWNEGAVEGTLATITPYDAPRGFLAAGDLDYRTGRVGVRVFPSGTDLLFQYQSMFQLGEGDIGSTGSNQRSFEVRLSQDLMDLDPLGSWRFLLALREAALRSNRPEEIVHARQADVIESLNHQLSAGLSVSF